MICGLAHDKQLYLKPFFLNKKLKNIKKRTFIKGIYCEQIVLSAGYNISEIWTPSKTEKATKIGLEETSNFHRFPIENSQKSVLILQNQSILKSLPNLTSDCDQIARKIKLVDCSLPYGPSVHWIPLRFCLTNIHCMIIALNKGPQLL